MGDKDNLRFETVICDDITDTRSPTEKEKDMIEFWLVHDTLRYFKKAFDKAQPPQNMTMFL